MTPLTQLYMWIFCIVTVIVYEFVSSTYDTSEYFNEKERETKRRCRELYERVTNEIKNI